MNNHLVMLSCSFVSIAGFLCLFSGNAIANTVNPDKSASHILFSDTAFIQNQSAKEKPPRNPPTVSTTPY